MVNLWLGFPYFFLVCSGRADRDPDRPKEAAYVDGASGRYAFRTVVLPLLLVATAPLLVTTFAFNFNNYTLIELLTGGGPFPGTFTRRRVDRPADQLHLPPGVQRHLPAAGPGVGDRHDHLRGRRDGLGVRLPVDQATRGDRHMSTQPDGDRQGRADAVRPLAAARRLAARRRDRVRASGRCSRCST